MVAISPERKARLEREKSRNAGSSGFIDFNQTKKVVVRQPPRGDRDLATVRVRYYLGKKNFVCPEGTHGKPGVIARTVRLLRALNDANAAEVAEGINAQWKRQYLMIVLDRADNKVKWLAAPKSVYEQMMAVENDQGDAIDDIKEGIDFTITRTGEKKQTRYICAPQAPSRLHPEKEVRARIVAEANEMDVAKLLEPDEQGALEALEEIVPPKIWNKIKAEVVAGTDLQLDDDEDADTSAEDDEDDEDEAPAKKAAATVDEDEDEAPAPAKKKAAVVEDDEDDEPVVPAKKKAAVVEEDDEDETPAPPKKAPKAAVVDDEEEEEAPPKKAAKAPVADDDDEEETQAPAKKSPVADEDDEEEVVTPRAPGKFKVTK